MTTHHSQKGFTLLELLLYIAVLSFVLLAMMTLFNLLIEVRTKNRVQGEVYMQGQLVMYEFNRIIKDSSDISLPSNGSSTTSATLSHPTVQKNPIKITLDGSKIFIQEGSSPAIAVTNNSVTVTNLTFRNLTRPNTNGNIQYSFTLSGANGTGRNEFNYSTTFYGGASLRQ